MCMQIGRYSCTTFLASLVFAHFLCQPFLFPLITSLWGTLPAHCGGAAGAAGKG